MDGGYGTSQMPLAGAILCFTSISPEQRTELAAIGSQMGANIKLDLTSDVTHLIVGNIHSAKYKYVARAREDVKVLSPQWLEALRTVWMEGHDNVNVAALEREYRLPTFYGLKICLTGFEKSSERKLIQETVMRNGAEYHGDLTKAVTHLIAATPNGKKYDHAMNWRLKVVSWEWFDESRQRGMVLDETCYHPAIPVEERGKGAWNRRQTAPSSPLGKRTRDPETSQAANPLRRKLRRAASSKMGTQSEALWAGITAASLEAKKDVRDDWTEDGIAKQSTSKDSAPIAHLAVAPQGDVQLVEDPASQPGPLPLPSNTSKGLFEGRAVLAHGFDDEKTNILRQHLDSNGATVICIPAEIENISDHDLTRGFLVVPHDVAVDLTLLPGGAGKMCLATNWWVERCLHGKSLVNPTDNVLCRPFDKLSISGFNELTVNSTAFSGIELLHVTKVIALMGATYDEMLTTKTSVIVCNTRKPNPEKSKFATDKGIPAVHSTWLWDCLSTGKLQPFDQYLLNAIAPRPEKPLQNHKPSLVEVPTAPLSEEDSAKLRNKKSLAMKNATSSTTTDPRGARQQPRACNLTKTIEPIPISSTSSTIPNPSTHLSFLYQDDDDEPLAVCFDGAAPIPLKDINPNVNSPRRPSTSSNASIGTLAKAKSTSTSRSTSTSNAVSKLTAAPRTLLLAKGEAPDSVISADTPTRLADDSVIQVDTLLDAAPSKTGPTENEKDHASIMASIMAARKSHAAAKSIDSVSKKDEKKKRRRQLGRATSTRSTASGGDDIASRTSSAAEGGRRGLLSNEESVEEGAEGDEERLGAKAKHVEYQPSQELGWDAPGAQEAREQMIRAMGGKVEDNGMMVGVESIGIVRDVNEGGGVGRRVGKRRG